MVFVPIMGFIVPKTGIYDEGLGKVKNASSGTGAKGKT